jgi:ParB/RepB/Spo0J family partition protein
MNPPETRKWKLSKLKKHPRQDEFFGDLPDAELRALATDMQRHGLRQPIEIRPSGEIITGHQRVLAAELLNWTEIDAIVRRDLDDKGDAAVEAHFLADNLHRRQLSPLGRARCRKRLMEIESGSRNGVLDWRQKEKLKATIGAQLRLSPRSLSRYLLVLKAPPAVQHAFDRNGITLIAAGKVARLPRSTQREISQRIEAGESAKKVVGGYLGKTNSRHRKVGDATACFLGALQRGLADLNGRLEKVGPAHVAAHLHTLRQARTVIKHLIGVAKEKTKTLAEAFADCFAADAE